MSFKILSLCGGGIRGILSIHMLERLNQQVTGQEINSLEKMKILDHVDMVAGTSTGAIIAGMLANGTSFDVLRALYAEMRESFMKGSHDPMKPQLRESKAMEAFMEKHFFHNKKLCDFDMKILMASFHVGTHQEFQPGCQKNAKAPINDSWGMVLFNNFANSETGGVNIVDAMASSGSMPGMSGTIPVKFRNAVNGNVEQYECVDGAFVNHDPTLAAIAMAVENGHPLEEISVITIGTGFMRNYIVGDTENWGSEQWMNLSEGNDSVVPPLLVNSEQKVPVLNMMMNGTSTNEIQALTSMLLKDRYAYLNADFRDTYIPEDAKTDAEIQFLRDAAADVDLTTAEDVFNTYWKV